jgi:adenosylcobinamide-phosphate synthase
MTIHANAAAMLSAIAIDAAIGWPAPLFKRIGHPVTWAGRLIVALDTGTNRGQAAQRRLAGVIAALIVIGLSAGTGAAAQALLPKNLAGVLLTGLLAWPLVAARSLCEHVAKVAAPLARGELGLARTAVSMIVGRDPAQLDSAGVGRAALESLAENTSDGIIAPLFWGVLLGLPGIAGYKAVNTLDSMLGHRTPRHIAFGWGSARIDDLANLIPARLTGLIFALVSARPIAALACMAHDASRHRSPNAGWPEAAMAGALGIRLSGPRTYDNRLANEPWLNPAGADPEGGTVFVGLALYRRVLAVVAVILALAIW